MFKLITSMLLLAVLAPVAPPPSDRPAKDRHQAKLADNAMNQELAEPVVQAIESIGLKPDAADTDRIGGVMTFTVSRDALMDLADKLDGKTISVGFDGKVTVQ